MNELIEKFLTYLKNRSTTMPNDEKIIKNNEKYFYSYVTYPAVATAWFAVLIFIWSIVDPLVFGGSYYYGVFLTETFIGSMLIWWLIGLISCFILYNTLKIILSPKILEIYYLKAINEKLEKEEN